MPGSPAEKLPPLREEPVLAMLYRHHPPLASRLDQLRHRPGDDHVGVDQNHHIGRVPQWRHRLQQERRRLARSWNDRRLRGEDSRWVGLRPRSRAKIGSVWPCSRSELTSATRPGRLPARPRSRRRSALWRPPPVPRASGYLALVTGFFIIPWSGRDSAGREPDSSTPPDTSASRRRPRQVAGAQGDRGAGLVARRRDRAASAT